MKKILIAIIVIVLGGCATAASNMIRQMPIIESNGSKSYLLTQTTSLYGSRKEFFDKLMDERANKLCPSGYVILNNEVYDVSYYGGFGTELVWQIKCKPTDQPKS